MSNSISSPQMLIDDPDYARLKQRVIESTGLAYFAEQDLELARQFTGRLSALNLPDCGSYCELLGNGVRGAAELDELIATLTIGETFFFRHQEQFDALTERVLPELIARNRSRKRLRIWSAGCATGAEPYSLAILLHRQWGELLADWDVTILGSDINRSYLAQARTATFGEWGLRTMPEESRESYFSKVGNQWVLRDAYRRWVSFQYHNLAQHPFPSLISDLVAFDLIVCRNVLIYFSQEIVAQVVERFRDCLVDEGWLMVGHAESNVEQFKAFQTINSAGAVLYQKQPRLDPSGETAATKEPSPPPANLGPPPSEPRQAPNRATESRDRDPSPNEKERLDPLFHFQHALELQRIGQHAEAERALRRTIYLDRKFALAHYHLALMLQKNRDSRAARRFFRNAIGLLDAMDADTVLGDAEGLTAGSLVRLTQIHLEVLETP